MTKKQHLDEVISAANRVASFDFEDFMDSAKRLRKAVCDLKKYEENSKKYYHVFTHGKDEYLKTRAEAEKIFEQFKSQKNCAWMYRVIGLKKRQIKNHGAFPHA